ncbi:hypothetical protein STTU_5809 [Streptomyces sp. Tu6071]|nr:hypothetical protein STTU_5809 [Streptomyces sp. Tu6071]
MGPAAHQAQAVHERAERGQQDSGERGVRGDREARAEVGGRGAGGVRLRDDVPVPYDGAVRAVGEHGLGDVGGTRDARARAPGTGAGPLRAVRDGTGVSAQGGDEVLGGTGNGGRPGTRRRGERGVLVLPRGDDPGAPGPGHARSGRAPRQGRTPLAAPPGSGEEPPGERCAALPGPGGTAPRDRGGVRPRTGRRAGRLAGGLRRSWSALTDSRGGRGGTCGGSLGPRRPGLPTGYRPGALAPRARAGRRVPAHLSVVHRS